MRIAMLNLPCEAPWLGPPGWITVPPQAYGGIQWLVANLISGITALGHQVILLGAPGSPGGPGIEVINLAFQSDVLAWLQENADRYDVIHDNSVGAYFASDGPMKPYVGSWHLTGRATYPRNTTYVSAAQRQQADHPKCPIIRVPVDPDVYQLEIRKSDYLLFLGRVSPWKGAIEAAQFAQYCQRSLLIAGPCWDEEYRQRIEREFGEHVTFLGEVGGAERLDLIRRAYAVMALSQPVAGPWGQSWVEPGATVVSEAAACGTPTVASSNGCLAEIVPHVGAIIPEGKCPPPSECRDILQSLPPAEEIRKYALENWGNSVIATQYLALYDQVLAGAAW